MTPQPLALTGLAVALVVAFWAGRSTAPPPSIPWPGIEEEPLVSYTYEAQLVRVIDADTVILNVDLGFEHWLHNQRFRLYGIDTPETRTLDADEKARGLAAKAWLEQRIAAGMAADGRLVVQSIQNDRFKTDAQDSFGRWLAILFLNGENLNETMMEEGHAAIYKPR